jgi:hypothetical protein
VLGVIVGASSPARAYHEGNERLIDYTAFTLRAREAQVGLLQLDWAPFGGIQVGTDTLPWAASAVLPVVVPNGHLKIRLFHAGPISAAVKAGIYYASVSRNEMTGGAGSIYSIPGTLFISTDLPGAFSLHLEGTYARMNATGEVDVRSLEARGGAIADSLQLGVMLERRFGRVVALTLRGRYQAYASPVKVRTRGAVITGDEARLDADLSQGFAEQAWAVLGGVALSWSTFNVQLGVGYGAWFLPTLGVVLPWRGVIPDGSMYVRF